MRAEARPRSARHRRERHGHRALARGPRARLRPLLPGARARAPVGRQRHRADDRPRARPGASRRHRGGVRRSSAPAPCSRSRSRWPGRARRRGLSLHGSFIGPAAGPSPARRWMGRMETEERIVEVMGTTAHVIVTGGGSGLADRAVGAARGAGGPLEPVPPRQRDQPAQRAARRPGVGLPRHVPAGRARTRGLAPHRRPVRPDVAARGARRGLRPVLRARSARPGERPRAVARRERPARRAPPAGSGASPDHARPDRRHGVVGPRRRARPRRDREGPGGGSRRRPPARAKARSARW